MRSGAVVGERTARGVRVRAFARGVVGSDVITGNTLLVAQSGGPTAVINASLAGVIEAAQQSGHFGAILGSRRGVEGIREQAFTDLTDIPRERLERLRRTPSAALGTSRHRQDDAEIARMLDWSVDRGVTAFVPIGGNDTAETAMRIAEAAAARGQELRVVAVPKTIDNDLPEMDHCPGYGSAARFVALATRDAAFDTRAMARLYPVKVVEVMGRNAGWLAAAGTLAFAPRDPRPIVCLPERPFASFDELARLVRLSIERDGYAILVVPETMRWTDGRSVAGDTPEWVDPFGHAYFPGVGAALARQLSAALGVRARYDKPGTIARMAMHAVSELDLVEASEAGRAAIRRALAGESGVMVAIVRESDDPYHVRYDMAPLESIAGVERRLPDEMIAPSGHDVTARFTTWARPLLGAPLASYETLD